MLLKISMICHPTISIEMSCSNTSQVHVLRLRPLPPAPRRPLAPRCRARRLPPRHRDAAQRPAADADRGAGGEAAAEGRGGCEAAAVDGDVA